MTPVLITGPTSGSHDTQYVHGLGASPTNVQVQIVGLGGVGLIPPYWDDTYVYLRWSDYGLSALLTFQLPAWTVGGSGSFALSDFEQRVQLLIKDAAGKLAAYDAAQVLPVNASIDVAIAQAAKHYSADRPQKVAQDYAGADSFDLALPTNWSDGFSTIDQIEYPFQATGAQNLTIDDDQYLIYQSPSGKTIHLISAVPQVGETLRVHYTTLHTIPLSGNTSIPDVDFDAVATLGAALALEQLADLMIQTGDPTLTADVVDYKAKSAQYLAAAKALRTNYERLMGKLEKDNRAATAQQQMTENLSVGLDRLTHMRRSRR